jgi:hypothetical protein
MSLEDEFLTEEQLAMLLKVDKRTTMRWRFEGGGPSYVRVGIRRGRVLYRRRDVDVWLTARTFKHIAEEAASGSCPYKAAKQRSLFATPR